VGKVDTVVVEVDTVGVDGDCVVDDDVVGVI
jgi:hypothetical protein